MNPILLDILQYVRRGYCCSQLLMLLALRESRQERGPEESAPELLRAMNGLCHGLGFSGGPCGLLTGGAAVLGLWAGRDNQREALACLDPVINDYAAWFAERTAPFGGCSCEQVVTGLQNEMGQPSTASQPVPLNANASAPDPLLCGNLLAESWEQLRLLAQDYDLDMNA